MVYLIHFNQPISPDHTCQHYIGYTRSLKKRIAEHKAGLGARLCQVANERGIDYQVVKTWSDGTRKLERQLKNRKNGLKLCPVCRGKNEN